MEDKGSRRGWSRRGIFEGIAWAGLAGAAASTAEAAPPAGESEGLPNFKYDLEAQTHWTGEGGSAKEATVAEFPISQSLAGVSMRLKPGAIRELHWHSLAAEWAYMIEGRCRVTVISPNGQAEVADFEQGDTWYFPRGHGHALQGLGPGECHFLLVFDNGHFSEFGTFSITDWMANTPPEILSRNLGTPASALARFPKKEVYIGTGRVPGPITTLRNDAVQPSQFSHKYRLGDATPVMFPGGEERIVSSVEFPIQTTLTAVRMDLKPGALREMHWHPHADEWQYYVSGRARVRIFGSHGRVRTEEFGKGHVAFIPQGFGHYVEQIGDEPTQILNLFNSGLFQEISLTAWLGANPASLLEDNFGASRSVVDQLPVKSKGIVARA
ncbi:MAG TPA: cupin domain-containing protein [Bryobacteraceae bacterium]|nr:cupin domain-containing protein [Bryobacteraceae bacterium]